MATREPRRRLRPEQRRELILDSALERFAERGYHASAISDIARGAGTTKAVVYDHFATKRELYDAVVERELDMLLSHIAATSAPDGDPRTRLRAIFDAWFEHVGSRPQSRRVMLETVDADRETVHDQRRTQMMATRFIAERLAAEPELLRDSADREVALEMAAQMLKSTLNGLADWWFDRPDVPRDRVVEAASAFVYGGLVQMSDDA